MYKETFGRFTMERGWKDGDVTNLYQNLLNRDRKESFFYTSNLRSHLRNLAPALEDNIVRVTDERGFLLMLGGLARTTKEPEKGIVWLLRTKWCKMKTADDRSDLSHLIRTAIEWTEDWGFTKIGNIVWNRQLDSVSSLRYFGFDINPDPVAIIDPMANTGLFYRFWRDAHGRPSEDTAERLCLSGSCERSTT